MKDPSHLILLHDRVRELEKRVSLLELRVNVGNSIGILATDDDLNKLNRAANDLHYTVKDFCGSQ